MNRHERRAKEKMAKKGNKKGSNVTPIKPPAPTGTTEQKIEALLRDNGNQQVQLAVTRSNLEESLKDLEAKRDNVDQQISEIRIGLAKLNAQAHTLNAVKEWLKEDNGKSAVDKRGTEDNPGEAEEADTGVDE